MLEKNTIYDITFIDIPVKNFSVENELVKKLNNMYLLNDAIFKIKTGHYFDEKKYYYSSGILCLSTYLKERNFNVGYINYPKDKSRLKKMVLGSRYIGFSTVTITIQTILRLSEEIKKWNPQIKILLGGYHASYCVKELLQKNKCIDGIIIGEGEIPIFQVLSGIKKDRIKGFCYMKENGEISINKEEHFLNENEIPSPDFSLIENDIENYNIYIGTMRGCIGKCNFCINHNYWGKPRYISFSKLEETFKYLNEKITGSRLIHIIDNVFTLNKERMQKFCDIIKPYKGKFSFECDTLSNLIDEEKIKILENTNVVKIGLGFEDCIDEINKIANKNTTITDNIKAAKMIKRYSPNICIYAYWLVGLPGSSIESLNKNIQMIRKLISHEIVHIISPKIFIPYPGTVFWEKSEEFDLYITSKKWDEYERVSPPYPYRLKNMCEGQLENSFRKVVDICIEEYTKKWNLKIHNMVQKNYVTWYENE